MEAVVERSNMFMPMNGGEESRSAGSRWTDGVRVQAMASTALDEVKAGSVVRLYQPEMVRKVEIPKPQGGVRILGVPTLGIRLIQQALNQVLQPLFDSDFPSLASVSVPVATRIKPSSGTRLCCGR